MDETRRSWVMELLKFIVTIERKINTMGVTTLKESHPKIPNERRLSIERYVTLVHISDNIK